LAPLDQALPLRGFSRFETVGGHDLRAPVDPRCGGLVITLQLGSAKATVSLVYNGDGTHAVARKRLRL
jgi:hypothetical protein